MFRGQQQSSPSSVSIIPRCNKSQGSYSLGQSSSSSSWGSSTTTSTITENDLLKYEDLNMDLKELNVLFKDLTRKKTQKNSNISKLNKKKKQNGTQTNRNSLERRYKEEETKFTKNIKKILSEKIREKALQRLDRLIKSPKEERLNKVACTLAALIDVLKSCNVPTSYDDLIKRYKARIDKEYPSGSNSAVEFIKNILERNNKSLLDFIAKQSTHNKKLGEVLKNTIKDVQSCSA
jgi:hypothetical protein